MKILLHTREKFPPFRVDSRILFGEALAQRDVVTDWLLQSGTKNRHFKSEKYGRGMAYIGPFRPGHSTIDKTIQTLQALRNSLRIIRLAKQTKYDFIQTRNVFVRALPCIIAAKLSGAKFVYWLSYRYPEAWIYEAKTGKSSRPWLTRIRGWLTDLLLYKIIFKQADFVFVQSEQMKLDLADRGVPLSKMLAVPMAVDDKMLIDLNNLPEKSDRPTVVYVGGLGRTRRMDFLVRVFARVLKSVPDSTMYVVGGDTEEQIGFLRDEASRLGISSSVVFTGMLPQNEAMEYIRRATVCVSPSYPTPILNSSSPTKLVEYMSQGSAVVANDHPEQTITIAESDSGISVAYDEEAFSRAVIEILKNRQMAIDMGVRGRKYVESRRVYSVIAEMVEEQYRTILAATR